MRICYARTLNCNAREYFFSPSVDQCLPSSFFFFTHGVTIKMLCKRNVYKAASVFRKKNVKITRKTIPRFSHVMHLHEQKKNSFVLNSLLLYNENSQNFATKNFKILRNFLPNNGLLIHQVHFRRHSTHFRKIFMRA